MAEHEPRYGHYATETQRVANELPTWTKARRERDSNLQQFINPMCRQLDELNDEMEGAMRDRFIELARADSIDQIRQVQLPAEVQLESPVTIRNRILNSSFELITSHHRIPDYWRLESGSVAYIRLDDGIFGAQSMELWASPGDQTIIYQEVDEPIRANTTWCWYIWYRTTVAGFTPAADELGLQIVGTLRDGSTHTLSTAFLSDTGGEPARAVILDSFPYDVVSWTMRVIVHNTPTSPHGGPTNPVVIDGAMAKEGNEVPNWEPHTFENYPYIDYYDRLTPIAIESPRRIQFVERRKDFWTKAIPTRVNGMPTLMSSGGTYDPVPTADENGFTLHAEAGSFTEVDYWKDEWPGVWQLGYQNGTPCIRGLGTKAPDIFGPFGLAFRNWRNWFEDYDRWIPEAMTAFHGYLWVVLRRLSDFGSIERYLAIVDPKVRRPFPDYMEVTAMLKLPGIPTTTMISRASIRYSDQQFLYVGNGESEWSYELCYDYFMLDLERKIIHLREDDEDIVPLFMVDRRDPTLSLRHGVDRT